jgi:large subunit ribosomal protein L24
MMKFKKGDKVFVRAGKDRGREGEIVEVFPDKRTAIVMGVNMYKKHVKKAVARDGKGGVYDLPRPIHLSKLMLIDPKTKKPTRVGFKIEGGKKLRIAKKSGVIIDTK